MELISVKEAIIVEGRYDKIKLASIFDAVIIQVNGFHIFKDRETAALIRHFAQTDGIIILTDSDYAGFRIRGYLKSIAKDGKVKNVYIPDIFGKEKRKSAPSAEGKLGVEGVEREIILAAFEKAGIASQLSDKNDDIDAALLFELGLSGCRDSAELRRKLLAKLRLPSRLATPSLLRILNTMLTAEKLRELVETL